MAVSALDGSSRRRKSDQTHSIDGLPTRTTDRYIAGDVPQDG